MVPSLVSVIRDKLYKQGHCKERGKKGRLVLEEDQYEADVDLIL